MGDSPECLTRLRDDLAAERDPTAYADLSVAEVALAEAAVFPP